MPDRVDLQADPSSPAVEMLSSKELVGQTKRYLHQAPAGGLGETQLLGPPLCLPVAAEHESTPFRSIMSLPSRSDRRLNNLVS